MSMRIGVCSWEVATSWADPFCVAGELGFAIGAFWPDFLGGIVVVEVVAAVAAKGTSALVVYDVVDGGRYFAVVGWFHFDFVVA